MAITDLQRTYLALACAAVLALAIIVGQVLYKAGSISVSSRASFVTAASMVLAVRAASFYMAMGHEQEQVLTNEVAEITANESHASQALLAATKQEADSSFAAEWTMVLNLDWGGVCFLAAMLTHVSSLMRSALAARTLDQYGVLKRVFCNQNGLTVDGRSISTAASNPGPAKASPARPDGEADTHRGTAPRTSSGGYYMGQALDAAPGTVGGSSQSASARRAEFRSLNRGSSLDLGRPSEGGTGVGPPQRMRGGANPYRPRKPDVRGNLLLPAAHKAVTCCTPKRIGTTLGAGMAVIVLSYFGVTLGFFFSVADRDAFENTVIPAYFCTWFAICGICLFSACYLHSDSGALVLHRPAPQGHCTPWLLCCARPRVPGGPYSYLDDIPAEPQRDSRGRRLSMDTILKRTRWCGALKGYPLSHTARNPLWAGALLCSYSFARAIVTLLMALHEQGALARSRSATTALYFGSEILLILLVCQILMPLISSGPFDTTDAEFVLALFRNMRLRQSVVQDVAQVFADVPAVMRTVASLPEEDVNRLHMSMQRQFLRTMGALQEQLRTMEHKADAHAQATQSALHSDAVASAQRAGEIMDALAAQQEEFRDWAEDATGVAPGLGGPGGFMALGGGGGGLQARLTAGMAAPWQAAGGADHRAAGAGAGGAYQPPPVRASGHSYTLGAAQLPTVPSPVTSMRSSESFSTHHSHRNSDGSGEGASPQHFASPGAIGSGLAGQGYTGSDDRGRAGAPPRFTSSRMELGLQPRRGPSPASPVLSPPTDSMPTADTEGSVSSTSPPTSGASAEATTPERDAFPPPRPSSTPHRQQPPLHPARASPASFGESKAGPRSRVQ